MTQTSSPPSPPVHARLINLAGHELRTPASVVIGYLRMLLAEHGGPLTERQRRMLTEAEHSSQRMNRIIAEMSELSNLQAGTLALARQRIALAPLLREAVEGIGPVEAAMGDMDASKGIEIRTPSDEVLIVGDPARLRTACSAVLRAMARERRDETPLVVDVRVEPVGDKRAAVVRVGTEPHLALLGGPRGEFDRWRGGLGLALPIAQIVIEAAGGEIWSPAGEASHAATGLAFPVAD
jgi:K+-sensing histidine kinase KdpD